MATETIPNATAQAPATQRGADFSLSAFLTRVLIQTILVTWAIIVIFPMLWLLYSSFKTDREIFFNPWSMPEALQWPNFERAWVSAHIGEYFLNSLLIVLPALLAWRAQRR